MKLNRSEWYSVKEIMPAIHDGGTSEIVILYCQDGGLLIFGFLEEGNSWAFIGDPETYYKRKINESDITYWAFIPRISDLSDISDKRVHSCSFMP